MGTDGLGKSTFASNAPSPIFIGAEDGTAQLDVERMPDIRSWKDLLDSAEELVTAPHDYKTIVLDTVDWAEPMCWDHVAKAAGKANVDDLPYGRGYSAALDQWRLLLSKLERAKQRGMHVILIAHTIIRTYKNPLVEVGDYDRFEMKMHAKASGLLREWADAVLFGNYETFSVTDDKKRTRGVSTGARILHTQRTAAFDAKNRYNLPPTLPLDWNAFAEAVAAQAPADPGQLVDRIEKMLVGASDDLSLKVREAVAAANGNAAQLARIADKLAARINIAAEQKDGAQ